MSRISHPFQLAKIKGGENYDRINRKTWKTKIIFQTAIRSLTVILTVLYALGIQSISLTTVNVLCLSFYFTQLAPGLIDHTNQQKAQWLFAAVFISASVTRLNLWGDYQT